MRGTKRWRARRLTAACALLTAAIGTVSCERQTGDISSKMAWSYDKSVGIAVVTAERACLAIGNSSVPANARVHVIDAQQQHDLAAVVLTARDGCAGNSPGMNGYELRFEGPGAPVPFVGIVVLSEAPPFGRRGTALATDLDRDSREEFFRTCTSTEGVHATVWSDAPLTGTRRWHQYQALGYDVEANCTPAEVNP